MYLAAVLLELEAGSSVGDKLQLLAAMMNRVNSTAWQREFGSGLVAQLTARNSNGAQLSVLDEYNINIGRFDSLEHAAQELSDAYQTKGGGVSVETAKNSIRQFIAAAANAEQYGQAVRAVGDSAGWRGNGVTNSFGYEAVSGAGARQPSRIRTAGYN